MFCVIAIAFVPTQEDIKELNAIDTKEISLTIPEEYSIAPLYKKDQYYRFINESDNSVYILCEKNKYINNGITKSSDADMAETLNRIFFRADKSYRLDNYTVAYTNGKQTKINGVTAYELAGKYSAKELVELGEREINKTFVAYIIATKESIYVIFFESNGDILKNLNDVNKMISTVAVRGTYFGDDELLLPDQFGHAKTFKLDASDASRKYYAANTSNGARITRAFRGMLFSPFLLLILLRRHGYLYIPNDSPIRKFFSFKRKNDNL